MNVKAALIDLDDTLTDTKSAYEKAYKECHKVFATYTGLNISYDEFMELYTKARADVHLMIPNAATRHNRALYFQTLVEDLKLSTDYKLVYKLYHAFYQTTYANLKPFPNAIELLEWLKKTQRKVVIVSNGSANVRLEKINSLGISNYIDFMVSSEEVGTEKPSANLFLHALHKARVSPGEAVMIGNKAPEDIYGANRLGITTILTKITDESWEGPNKPGQEPSYTVKDLKDVIDIIQYLEGYSTQA